MPIYTYDEPVFRFIGEFVDIYNRAPTRKEVRLGLGIKGYEVSAAIRHLRISKRILSDSLRPVPLPTLKKPFAKPEVRARGIGLPRDSNPLPPAA
jgi:hypothetical protein